MPYFGLVLTRANFYLRTFKNGVFAPFEEIDHKTTVGPFCDTPERFVPRNDVSVS